MRDLELIRGSRGSARSGVKKLWEALGELWEGLYIYKNSRSTAPAAVMLQDDRDIIIQDDSNLPLGLQVQVPCAAPADCFVIARPVLRRGPCNTV